MVKICGITREADGRAALAAGAGLVGFVLAASPRRVSARRAAELVRALRRTPRGRRALMVGVFKDQPVAEVLRAARRARFDLVQLHGAETPAGCRRVLAAGFPVMKVVKRTGAAALAQMRRFPCAGAFLLEPRARGRTTDWRGARAALAAHPRVGIAGRLSPENVGAALGAAGPGVWLVDASSALEAAPGLKDHRLVRRFIAAARRARAR